MVAEAKDMAWGTWNMGNMGIIESMVKDYGNALSGVLSISPFSRAH